MKAGFIVKITENIILGINQKPDLLTSCNLLTEIDKSGIMIIILNKKINPLIPKFSKKNKESIAKIWKSLKNQNSLRVDRVSKSKALLKQSITELIKSSKILFGIAIILKTSHLDIHVLHRHS